MVLKSKNLILLGLLFTAFAVTAHDEDYDLELDLLEDSADLYDSSETEVDINDVPKLSKDGWLCGDCGSITDDKLIYSEQYETKNLDAEENYELQIGISAEGMRCVSISGDGVHGIELVRGSGSCRGPYVTLVLKTTSNVTIIVKAYE